MKKRFNDILCHNIFQLTKYSHIFKVDEYFSIHIYHLIIALLPVLVIQRADVRKEAGEAGEVTASDEVQRGDLQRRR